MSAASVLGKLGSCIGKGILAGLAGTAAITISQMIEMKIRDREPSDSPSKVAGKVMGVQPRNQEGKKRFTQMMHWAYGTSWGVMRGLTCFAGLKGVPATLLHFAAIWGTELVMIPNMTESPPATEWGGKELGIDASHHAVYAAAAGAVYDFMDKDE